MFFIPFLSGFSSLLGGVLKGDASSSRIPCPGSRLLHVLLVGVCGFAARLTGGGFLELGGISFNPDCSGRCDEKFGMSCSRFRLLALDCRGGGALGEIEKMLPLFCTNPVCCFGRGEPGGKIGLGGDTGVCKVIAGGVRGGDQGPIDTGLCLEAAPGSRIRGFGFSGSINVCCVLLCTSLVTFHGEGLRGISRDDRPLSGVTCGGRAVGVLCALGAGEGGLLVVIFSK